MIKATELRIGNLVSYKGDLLRTIKEILSDGIICAKGLPNGNPKCLLEDISPVILTEEWLREFGFYKATENSYTHFRAEGKEITTHLQLTKKRDSSHAFTLTHYHDKKFEYNFVHQLQNLYFVLTGEELAIKKEELIK